jgi:hypothetical protein
MKRKFAALVAMLGAFTFNAGAWDYESHRAVNELALASLPSDFGGFELTPALKDRIAFLAGEPDRWQNVGDLPLKHLSGPEHYIDWADLPLYEMEKNGQLTGEGDKVMEGLPFLENQLVKAGQMLGDIWYTAWLEAPEDKYLEAQLDRRNAANSQSK